MGGGISGRPGLHHDVHDAHALSFRQHHERIEIERDKPFAERVGHPPEADKRFLQRGDVGGVFAAMKSTGCDGELREAGQAIRLLGGEVEAVHDYHVPLTDVTQRLVVVRKVKPTPGKYPRPFRKISAAPL